jgi:hypothetical protein
MKLRLSVIGNQRIYKPPALQTDSVAPSDMTNSSLCLIDRLLLTRSDFHHSDDESKGPLWLVRRNHLLAAYSGNVA